MGEGVINYSLLSPRPIGGEGGPPDGGPGEGSVWNGDGTLGGLRLLATSCRVRPNPLLPNSCCVSPSHVVPIFMGIR